MLTADQAFALVLEALQSGRLEQAAAMCRVLSRAAPEHPLPHLHLGLIERRLGRAGRAVTFLRRAAALAPDAADILANLAIAAQDAGAAGAALTALSRAAALDPALPAIFLNRAVLRRALGDAAAARADFRRVLILNPALAEGHFGDGDGAAPAVSRAALRRALICRGDFLEAWINLGAACHGAGDAAAAARHLRRAVALAPANAGALMNLAAASRNEKADASTLARRAVRLAPDDPAALTNLATLTLGGEASQASLAPADLAPADLALRLYRRALALAPAHAPAWYNQGCALDEANATATATAASFTRAIVSDPAHDEARMNLGMLLLRLGELRRGWPAYEARLANPANRPPLPASPRWRGEDVSGKTVLLVSEQGFGDTLQFIRYAPMVAARGARVILATRPELAPLLRAAPGVAAVTLAGAPFPPHDLHCPLLSLPGVFQTGLDDIPAPEGYLRADPALAAAWAERLNAPEAPGSSMFKVGLIWAGSPTFKAEQARSPRLAAMIPLLKTPGVSFHILQMGAGRRDLDGWTAPANVVDHGPAIAGFTDTAAIMENLDLVVSSCTGPAHLAAALGRPTWIILPYAADWRWLTGREDSPWYRSVRLFRQDAPGDWGPAVARVQAALSRALANRPAEP